MGYKNFITTRYGGACLQSQHTEGRGRQISVSSRPSSSAQSSRLFLCPSILSIHPSCLSVSCFCLLICFGSFLFYFGFGFLRLCRFWLAQNYWCSPASVSQGLRLLGRATMPTSVLCCLKASRKLIIVTILQHFRSLETLVRGCAPILFFRN